MARQGRCPRSSRRPPRPCPPRRPAPARFSPLCSAPTHGQTGDARRAGPGEPGKRRRRSLGSRGPSHAHLARPAAPGPGKLLERGTSPAAQARARASGECSLSALAGEVELPAPRPAGPRRGSRCPLWVLCSGARVGRTSPGARREASTSLFRAISKIGLGGSSDLRGLFPGHLPWDLRVPPLLPARLPFRDQCCRGSLPMIGPAKSLCCARPKFFRSSWRPY